MAKPSPLKRQFSTDAFKAFLSEVDKETDRSAVILVSARIDNLLREALENALLPCTTDNDDLLDDDRPLSTFSARIKMCYRLGLIDEGFTKSLIYLKKIRNSFAHQDRSASVETSPYYDWARAILAPYEQYEIFETWVGYFYKESVSFSQYFKSAIVLMTLRLEGLCEGYVSLASHDPCKLMPPTLSKEIEAPPKSADNKQAKTK